MGVVRGKHWQSQIGTRSLVVERLARWAEGTDVSVDGIPGCCPGLGERGAFGPGGFWLGKHWQSQIGTRRALAEPDWHATGYFSLLSSATAASTIISPPPGWMKV